MKEKWEQFKNQITSLWNNSSKIMKSIFIGVTVLLLAAIIFISIFTSKTKYVPLYSNLSIEETGQIKEELDSRNVPYEISDNGNIIKVPEEDSEQLLVDLAGEGIPHSGHIDYSFFSENTSWGVTDNEFNMMKLDAMQTELADMMTSVEGIEDAKVMINLPEESVFVSDVDENASVSIVLDTEYGHEFEDNQIKSLYNLVSKAIPDLSEDNIEIRNQYLEYFEMASSGESLQGSYANQQEIKRDIEKDIQKRLQQMLGTIVGAESVIVSVTADVDFTQENTTEELVEPVDVDNMEGIPVSIETLQETFEGTGAEGGVAGTGDEDIPNYPAANSGGEGDYESTKETVNYELNHIHNDIVQAPYKLRDLGIQVAVDNVKQIDGDDVQLLDNAEQNDVEDGINSILDSMITTSIDKEYGEIDPDEKVSVVFQTFNNKDPFPDETPSSIPVWTYIVGALLLLVVILLVIYFIRRRRVTEEVEEVVEEPFITSEPEQNIPNIDTQPKSEAEVQKEQLEKMAKDKPDDFAKLLRSWISED